MLMLLFYVGDDRYAIESSRVVEVLPRVALKKLHQTPDYIAGLFNYRGAIVPAIDLCQLFQGHPCKPHLSTRIVLVNYLERENTPQLLGLMAERVTETLNKSEIDLVEPATELKSAPYLGKMIVDERGMIQCVNIEYLLPESLQTYALPKPEN